MNHLLPADRRYANRRNSMANGIPVAEEALADSRKVEAEYFVPYLAHAAMEPLNCTVRIGPDSCELWVGTQFQTVEQNAAAAITGLKPEQVKVHTPFLGGAFGRRATAAADVVSEAVHVAKAAGAPVKTVWTREDDTRGGYYRPMFLERAAISLGEDGLPEAWDHTLVGQSIMTGTPFEGSIKNGVDNASVEGVSDSPYIKDLAHHRVEIVASLPCYSGDNVDRQRGKGVFDKSIAATPSG